MKIQINQEEDQLVSVSQSFHFSMRYASIARSLATVLLLLLVAAGRCVRSAPANMFQPTDVSTERLSARYAHAAAAWSGVVCVFGGYTDEMGEESTETNKL